ncbi:unnamed protein product [Heligmosomoides polygyrus]|uniref:Uncharacterized protein n=1 Tax=Heligmosomoides polygyrus TaxID=6339 RepID=A0A183GC88_HELPZ|nr:unnamed protein product [Heligmosomoides polygyrus]
MNIIFVALPVEKGVYICSESPTLCRRLPRCLVSDSWTAEQREKEARRLAVRISAGALVGDDESLGISRQRLEGAVSSHTRMSSAGGLPSPHVL